MHITQHANSRTPFGLVLTGLIQALSRRDDAEAQATEIEATKQHVGSWLWVLLTSGVAVAAMAVTVLTNWTRFLSDTSFFLATAFVTNLVLPVLLMLVFDFAAVTGTAHVMVLYLDRLEHLPPWKRPRRSSFSAEDEIALLRCIVPPTGLSRPRLLVYLSQRLLLTVGVALFAYGAASYFVVAPLYVIQRFVMLPDGTRLPSELVLVPLLGSLALSALLFVGHVGYTTYLLWQIYRTYPPPQYLP